MDTGYTNPVVINATILIVIIINLTLLVFIIITVLVIIIITTILVIIFNTKREKKGLNTTTFLPFPVQEVPH